MELVSTILAYLIGGIPFAVIISYIKKINIMEVGTRNPGAANVFRQVGKTWGITVWGLDTAKGAGAMAIAARLLTPRYIVTQETHPMDSFFIAIAGIAAFCGHCWSPWLKFRGGRGVATAGGIFLYIIPKIFPIATITYFIVQRKPREPWVIITAFAIVLGLTVWIYWAQRGWLVPFLVMFLIIAVIANIPTIKEMLTKRRKGNENLV